MGEPPFYLQAVMHTIETTVLKIRQEFPRLMDDDVEYAYDKLHQYYSALRKAKVVDEPSSTREKRQVLMDEILNAIEVREEIEADLSYVNDPDITHDGVPIPSLPALYVPAFNRLKKSVRFWRKESGKTGYLNFIDQHVI